MYLGAVGTALPGEPVDNARLGKLLGVSDEWIDIFVGTETRHFGWDLGTGEVLRTLTDLCAEAGAQAMAAAALEPADIEFLVLATATPDTLLPTTATQTADLLGLDQLPVHQVQAGCSGAVQALDLARALLGTGYRTGLVIGGDVTHRHLDLSRDLTELSSEELVNYLIFGDGAGAAVLSGDPLGEAVEVKAVLNRFVGLGRAPGQLVDWYGVSDRHSPRRMVMEDYKAIESGVPELAAEALWDLLQLTGWAAEEVGYLLPPQLSGAMTERIVRRLALPRAREISCVRATGNTANALPFLQLDQLLGELGEGERALAVSIESSKWIKTGFALEKAALR
ncbi:3-oxoacyl-ACP synthase III family protein [Kitasatospora sp. NBC_01287]|uniref:3-oxoacyl-ACP synthase III family protein n=1 Tax=Kitasatospora sp. NBC_01287 TaxID=2903573 RepID=UPI00224D2758|nr:3-oxoacyl-ACP synthase III family protein [Kitasatospora sp. NBC_01287]MCX4750333.1 3-oxoacyl-ACP synthase III family protein [Kitasatospora sp. NBC_01287]